MVVTKPDQPTSTHSSDRLPGFLEPMKPVNDLGRIVSVEQNHARPEREPAGFDCNWGAGRRSTG